MLEAEHRLRAYVERYGGRLTGMRKLIVREVHATDCHFSGDDIFLRLRNKGHDISRASIFRTLPLLVDAGLLRVSLSTEKHRHYEHTLGHAHHEHLVCNRCGHVEEFHDPGLEVLLLEIAARSEYLASDHKVEVFGLCGVCRGDAPRPDPGRTMAW